MRRPRRASRYFQTPEMLLGCRSIRFHHGLFAGLSTGGVRVGNNRRAC